MIVNEDLLIKYISNWLADYVKQYDCNSFVLVKNEKNNLLEYICREATKIYGGLKIIKDCDNYISANNIATENKGIIIGSIDRTNGLYYRGYNKMGELLADIFPLFDIEYSEIVQVSKKLCLEYPTFTDSALLEFCNEAESLYNIITMDNPPHTHERWPYFTHDQKQWIGIVHQREKKTRHKKLTRPFPIISDKPHICRRSVQ